MRRYQHYPTHNNAKKGPSLKERTGLLLATGFVAGSLVTMGGAKIVDNIAESQKPLQPGCGVTLKAGETVYGNVASKIANEKKMDPRDVMVDLGRTTGNPRNLGDIQAGSEVEIPYKYCETK